MDLGAARAAARDKLKQIAAGHDPRDTIGRVLERYEREHLADKRTGRDIARLLRKELPLDLPIWKLHRADLSEMHARIRVRAPVTANRALGYALTFVRWCVAVGILDAMPVPVGFRVAVRAKERPRNRVLSDDEIARVWSAAADLGWYGRLVRLALLTGQRRGELAALCPEWIDADGWCTIPAEHYKSERPHRFYLTPFAREFVGEVPADPPWSRWKMKLDRAARLERPFTVHDTRRTMASGCRRLGVDRDVVELMLGHTVGGLIGVYQHYDFSRERQEAFEGWDRHVRGVVA
jgi:integrase